MVPAISNPLSDLSDRISKYLIRANVQYHVMKDWVLSHIVEDLIDCSLKLAAIGLLMIAWMEVLIS